MFTYFPLFYLFPLFFRISAPTLAAHQMLSIVPGQFLCRLTERCVHGGGLLANFGEHSVKALVPLVFFFQSVNPELRRRFTQILSD